MILKKSPAPMTLEERTAAAEASAASALSLFETVALDLEAAAADAKAVQIEAAEEIRRLAEIEASSLLAADRFSAQATRVREFVK